MKKTSLIYTSPRIYSLLMKLLYGNNYVARFMAIAEEIPDNTRVLDVCCGDCALYTRALRRRVSYKGVDINPVFLSHARKSSIEALQLDIRKDHLPPSDYVVMQASLYQFIPNHKKIVDKLLESASKKVIISEPVKNLSTSDNPFIAMIARYSANPGNGHKVDRFTEKSFCEFFTLYYQKQIDRFKFISGKRELMVILNSEGNTLVSKEMML